MEIIHIVLGKANPDRLNGVNKVVYQMATEQQKAGKNVQVWGITPQPTHDYPARNFKTELFQAEEFAFALPKALAKATLAHKNAVFHLHGGWVPVFSTLAKFFQKNQLAYVLTPHGAYNQIAMERSWLRKQLYFQLFEKRLLRGARKVHAIGASEVEGLYKLSPKTQSLLLPYGFDYETSETLPAKNEKFTIGFVGRLDIHTKGLDLLLKAFYNFQIHRPDSILWIIGAGEGEAYINKFIAEKRLRNVVLWGKKFGAEKDALISKMHVFAHPSRNEGLPTAVLEAAALGTPPIVTQATNVASYLGNFGAGIGIDNEDTKALTQAMEQFRQSYQQNEIASYFEGAKKMLTTAFSWPVLVHQYDELYQ